MESSPSMTAQLSNFICPLCGQESQRRFQKYEYWIRDCKSCGHRFAELQTTPEHTVKTYDDDYFTGGGAGYPNYVAEARLLRQHGNRYAKLLKKYVIPGRILDIGAAAGLILQGFEDEGWQVQGIEPNPTMARYAQQTLNIPVEVGTLEQWQSNETFEAIAMIQVVAHFFDIQAAFATASRHTKPGGFWLIETWNVQSWMAKILRQNWHEYSPPSVLHWFNPKSLAQFCTRYGFREVARGRPTKQISGAHAKSLLQYKIKDFPAGALLTKVIAAIPDRWSIPYPAEDLFWMLLQKQ
jgi:2-polyprenyl-3-methyl-5-hydroxy-6-metoxy-1,4-benzoquinol methylase